MVSLVGSRSSTVQTEFEAATLLGQAAPRYSRSVKRSDCIRGMFARVSLRAVLHFLQDCDGGARH